MDTGRKAIINSIGSLVVFLAQWIISVFLVRVSGYEEAGVFSLAMSVSNVFSFFANYNIRNYQISDIRQMYTQRQYLYTRIATVIFSFIICIVYLGTASGYNRETKFAIFIYLAYSNINVISDVMLGSLQIRGRLDINGYSNMIRGIACLTGFTAAYILKNLLTSLCVMVMVDLLVTLVYDARLFRKCEGRVTLPEKEDMTALCSILKNCFLLMLSNMFPIIVTAVPRRKIQLFFGEGAVGIFSSIFTPTALIVTLAPALVLSIIPILSDYWNQKAKAKFVYTVCKCYLLCITITLLAEALAVICGKPVMKLVFGESILPYYNLLYWAIAVTGLNAMTSCGNAILIPMRKSRLVVFASLLSMICTVVLADSLIQEYNITGATYVLLLAYIVQNSIQILAIVYYIITEKEGDLKDEKSCY